MTLGDVGRKKKLMIFVPIWPKNDIRLEEHDFSNFLFFLDRLSGVGEKQNLKALF